MRRNETYMTVATIICIVVLTMVIIFNINEIGHNERTIDNLSEQQEFLSGAMLEIVKNQASIIEYQNYQEAIIEAMLKTQGVILEILGE